MSEIIPATENFEKIAEKKDRLKCVYCGNNPVPHFMNWYFETLNIIFTPLRQFILYNPLIGRIKIWAAKFNFFYFFARFFSFFKIIAF
jgi:hypothetical protein